MSFSVRTTVGRSLVLGYDFISLTFLQYWWCLTTSVSLSVWNILYLSEDADYSQLLWLSGYDFFLDHLQFCLKIFIIIIFYMNKEEIFKNRNKSCSCTFWCLGMIFRQTFFRFTVSTYHEGFEMIKIHKVLPKTKLNMTGQQLVAVLSAKFCLNAQIELRPAERVCYSRTKGFIYCTKISLYCISSQWLNYFLCHSLILIWINLARS